MSTYLKFVSQYLTIAMLNCLKQFVLTRHKTVLAEGYELGSLRDKI